MRCNKCGYDNPDDAKYCINCGREIDKSNVCKHCGAQLADDAVFCTNCGSRVNISTGQTIIEEKVKQSPLAKACLIISIIGAAITLIAMDERIALAGVTLSTISLVMLAIGLLAKKIKGNIRFALGLGIYGVIGNILWLFFLMWMLPNF